MTCDFEKVIKILLGGARAWKLVATSSLNKMFVALAQAPKRICVYFDIIRDIGIPGQIPDDGLDYWESDLALRRDSSLNNKERNDRIIAKLSAVGGQGSDYIEGVIQTAGYDMYITENNPVSSPDVRAYTTTLGGFTLGSGATLGAYTDRIDPRTIDGILIAGPDIFESRRNYISTLGGFTLGDGTTLGEYTSTETIPYTYEIPAVPGRYIFIWFLHGPLGLNDFVDLTESQFRDLKRIINEIKPANTWVIVQANII